MSGVGVGVEVRVGVGVGVGVGATGSARERVGCNCGVSRAEPSKACGIDVAPPPTARARDSFLHPSIVSIHSLMAQAASRATQRADGARNGTAHDDRATRASWLRRRQQQRQRRLALY